MRFRVRSPWPSLVGMEREAMLFPSGHLRSTSQVKKELIVVSEEIDWLPPLTAYELLYRPRSFLLESVAGGSRTARLSILGISPLIIFESKNGVSRTFEDGTLSINTGDPLVDLAGIVNGYTVYDADEFNGGAIGYFGYDIGRYIEKLPNLAKDDLALSDCLFFVMHIYVWFNHLDKKAKIICLSPPDRLVENKSRVKEVKNILKDKILRRVEPKASYKVSMQTEFVSNYKKIDFEAAVEKAKEYIFAGDIYQVNLSQRLTARLISKPLEIYKQLRKVNPSPFAGYFDFGDWQMIGCSPERLLKLNGRRIETRPIAGTIRRGVNDREDKLLVKQLLRDIKERAEHIMLVDLERNDLGRVAEYGSVKVDELMVTESYSHVTHIVSNIIGRLRQDKDRFDLIKACFPGGTITGCPKIRAMEIIEELEPVRRGPYTGSMGYLGFNGDMDINIIIRTLIIKDGLAHVQAGAGIVADSIPEKEYYETLYKAEALIKATNLAEAGEDG